ncbi:prolyl-tRNA synthetase [Candidatus Kaiserbacteria bacterium]|nr:prolyl-tRNA synthetase [Candidatus Kaiserbacteria bacterium]
MQQSQLFTKTRKEAPSDEVSKNAQLLIRAGYIHKEIAGVYSLLPLGRIVFENIKNIVREEMNVAGGEEVSLSALQDPELWKETDRWNDEKVDVWFKTRLQNGTELGLGFTHEEPMARMMKDHISSHKDLPRQVYHFQKKFRNETRAKSGIMRTREFVMKDLYTFAKDEEEHTALYERMAEAYKNIFDRIGIGDKTFKTFASGGVFSKYSHEFQTIVDAGEDTIYVSKEKGIAINEEVYTPEVLKDLGVSEDELEKVEASEVGNIFSLGTRFSEPLGLTFKNEAGESVPVVMGSYGIGPARIMGVVTELFSDEKGLVWPESIAPFQVHLVGLNGEDEEIKDYTNGIYSALTARGVEVLYDDRDLRPGEKFAESDLLGMPYRVVVSRRTKEEGQFEVVTRVTGETRMLSEEELLQDFVTNEEDDD